MAENYGKIQQVIGPTVDLEFDSDHLPEILNAIRILTPTRASISSLRSPSTSATTWCVRSPWTPPTDSSAA